MTTWSAEGYLRHAAFVPELGSEVLELLAAAPGERILDLGCGEGTLTASIAARGATVIGIDSSPAFVGAARARGLDARLANAESLTFEDEFDAVFSNAALHWMRDQDAVLANVRRALHRGGRFVGEFGGHGNVAAIHIAIRAVLEKRGVTVDRPWFFPTDSEYRAKLEAHGFFVDRIDMIPRPTPLPTGMAGWLETFAGALFLALPAPERQPAAREAEDLLRPALCDDHGRWTADYVRLRFAAHQGAFNEAARCLPR